MDSVNVDIKDLCTTELPRYDERNGLWRRWQKPICNTETQRTKKLLTDQAWSVMLRASWGRCGNEPPHHWLSSTLTFWLSWISLGWGWLWSCRLRCDSHYMGRPQSKLLFHCYFHVPCKTWHVTFLLEMEKDGFRSAPPPPPVEAPMSLAHGLLTVGWILI